MDRSFKPLPLIFVLGHSYRVMNSGPQPQNSVSKSTGAVDNLTGNTRLGQTRILADHVLPVPEGHPRPSVRGEEAADLLVLPHLK
jgi:hypothetical protein